MKTDVQTGKVYLVGAGPGDPGLITVRGRECIRRAEVLVYDYLAAPELLRHAADTAERIYVGKQGGDHTLSQDDINRLLVEKARAGHIVTRLKGGDPFIFGRGGEEAEVLVENGIAFEIVPGVTSAVAAPAYAGIPLTHRQFTSTLAFVTGHEDPNKEDSSIDWPALAGGIGTLVFFMGVKNLPRIVDRLVAHGRSPRTPVALVRWGTTARQRTVTGTLADIVDRVAAAGLKAPCIIVVGEVVQLRRQLQWFESGRPLLGRTIVVTRARAQASDLVARLGELGAECLECPTIRVVPPDDWAPLDAAIAALDRYRWIVFTSVNGVSYFFQRLFALGHDVRRLGHLRTAVIGPATAARLADFGICSDIVPESYRAESVVDAFAHQDLSGARILLPRAAEARPVLPEELSRLGARVDEIPVYHTVPDDSGRRALVAALEKQTIDMVTFTSSSTVRNFKALLPADRFEALMAGVTVASIGPITSETAAGLGFHVDLSAATFTIEGLVTEIVAHYSKLDA
ncbi:MAG: uroporphyrinogen-III C-methyltransferase [Desulfobacterales bacterium]|jgi:uroporphyrinogen III methyltransferase/synthase|nr:uroporphyrinogen-III C-methyltransferase [Desulfobacterales bacterium]